MAINEEETDEYADSHGGQGCEYRLQRYERTSLAHAAELAEEERGE